MYSKGPWIHPLSVLVIHCGLQRKLETRPTYIGREAEHTLDRTPIYLGANTETQPFILTFTPMGDLYVFVLWEETRGLKRNPHRHGENI